jgi:hypothetical protein
MRSRFNFLEGGMLEEKFSLPGFGQTLPFGGNQNLKKGGKKIG